ncbi:hypothetical protein VNO77_02861 [Canavalia gladiata]|uniref:Uncharacterized protein n=1 Tax=Canavalia gladiata TaxID=3824 RepID=A0AAN9R3D7_CANGL
MLALLSSFIVFAGFLLCACSPVFLLSRVPSKSNIGLENSVGSNIENNSCSFKTTRRTNTETACLGGFTTHSATDTLYCRSWWSLKETLHNSVRRWRDAKAGHCLWPCYFRWRYLDDKECFALYCLASVSSKLELSLVQLKVEQNCKLNGSKLVTIHSLGFLDVFAIDISNNSNTILTPLWIFSQQMFHKHLLK